MMNTADDIAVGALTRRQLLRTTAVLVVAPTILAFAPAEAEPPDRLHAWQSGTGPGLEGWVRERLSEAAKAVSALKAVRGPRTIGNTLESYDRARNVLAMAANQTQLLASAGATTEVREAARRSAEAAGDAALRVDLDPEVFAALLALSRTREARRSGSAVRRYIDQALVRGRLAGADRDDNTRLAVARLQSRISALSARYAMNMHGAVGTVEVNSAELHGMPADFLARHPANAQGVVTLSTAQIDVQPVLRFASDTGLRRRMHLAYENQAFPANAVVLAELVLARAELAHTLSHPSYADLTLSDQMVDSAAQAQALLDRIEVLSRATAALEASAVQAFARSVDLSATVTAADATFWGERYRRERFGIDAQELRSYLPFARVLPGIIGFAAGFFRVRFTPVTADLAWHPQVAVFDVHDAAPGSKDEAIGRIYVDAHPRSGKDQIFATAPLTPGIGGRQLPEGVILCNLPGGAIGDSGLLNHSDVVNLVHEFGHLMHHVLSGRGRWSGQGAFDTEEDFLEAPSQMLEEFARDASVLQSFSRHHITGEILPTEVIERLNRSATFGRAAWLRAQLQRAQFALAIHLKPLDATAIEAEHQSTLRLLSSYPLVADTHEYCASPHLIGYGPNYYMYLLDKVIAVDFAGRFPAADPSAGVTSPIYREKVLEPGASRSARALVHDFLGRGESLDSLSKWIDGTSGRQ